jgi:hypothetical protein
VNLTAPVISKVLRSSGKVLIKLPDINQIFTKVSSIKFMKISLVGAELIRVDRRTDMTELIGAFCDCVNIYKNLTLVY